MVIVLRAGCLLWIALLWIALPWAGASMGAGVAATGGALDTAAAANSILRAANAFRQQQGRGTLSANAQLGKAAQEFASFMARTRRFSHEADGREPADRARGHGYAYCIVDENIGFEQRDPEFTSDELAARLMQGWEASPPHRRNLLDPDVVDTGIGLAQDPGTGRWYGVQMFGTPESARVTFDVINDTASNVRYRLGERTFELAPRVTRTHEQCRRASLKLDAAGEAARSTVQPRKGGHYRVVRDASGSIGLAAD
jgi:Cysteine-rich secretory protein family